jgi:hypothetical protein
VPKLPWINTFQDSVSNGPSAAVQDPRKPDILTVQPASIRLWRAVTYSNRTRHYAPGVGTIDILDLVRNGGYAWNYKNNSHLRFLL